MASAVAASYLESYAPTSGALTIHRPIAHAYTGERVPTGRTYVSHGDGHFSETYEQPVMRDSLRDHFNDHAAYYDAVHHIRGHGPRHGVFHEHHAHVAQPVHHYHHAPQRAPHLALAHVSPHPTPVALPLHPRALWRAPRDPPVEIKRVPVPIERIVEKVVERPVTVVKEVRIPVPVVAEAPKSRRRIVRRVVATDCCSSDGDCCSSACSYDDDCCDYTAHCDYQSGRRYNSRAVPNRRVTRVSDVTAGRVVNGGPYRGAPLRTRAANPPPLRGY